MLRIVNALIDTFVSQPVAQTDENDMAETQRTSGHRERSTHSQLYQAYESNRSAFLRTKEELTRVVEVLHARDQELLLERDHTRVLEGHMHHLDAKLAERDNAVRREQEKRLAVEDLLAKRTAELDAANALLPAPESVTDTGIIELVQEVNYEITQAATILAEAYEGHPRTKPSRDLLASVHPDVLACIEECGAARILHQRTTVDPTTALQIGLQASLIDIARILLSSETFSHFAGFDSVFRALKQGEKEHVATHWYALTHKYARASMSDITDVEVAGRIAMYMSQALVVAGYDPAFEIHASASRLFSTIETQLVDISRLILQLDTILGEKVTNGWMECVVSPSGAPFQGDCMEAAFQGEEPSSGADVVCATAFGLRRVVQGEVAVLVKPMVALSTLLSND